MMYSETKMDAKGRRKGEEKREKRMGPRYYDNPGNDISGGWPRRDVDSGCRKAAGGFQSLIDMPWIKERHRPAGYPERLLSLLPGLQPPYVLDSWQPVRQPREREREREQPLGKEGLAVAPVAAGLAGWLVQEKSSWFPRELNPGQPWRGLRLPRERRIRRRTPSATDTLPGAPGILRDNFGATVSSILARHFFPPFLLFYYVFFWVNAVGGRSLFLSF